VLVANLAAYDITVNEVSPSLVGTTKVLQNTDVVGTVAFLASDDTAFITGQIIHVDGGSTRR
jgi:NAD(P)-dependent dehydrogenase (short-subunit alcohol dehydrogenase family)